MSDISKALHHLNRKINEREHSQIISFEEFLGVLASRPHAVVRNVFQTFHDMIHSYVGEGQDEYPDDPESINYVNYDCRSLFAENTDRPFFADRLFANRLISHVESMKSSSQQNMIYVFKGPPGSGKSTFLNNLLLKFEDYANSDAGMRYEVVWRLDRRLLAQINETQLSSFVDRLSMLLDEYELGQNELADVKSNMHRSSDYVEICCPSHDNPLLLILKKDRRLFFDDLFKNNEFKWKLFTEKEYEWVFRDNPCTICCSIFDALLQRLPNFMDIFRMVYCSYTGDKLEISDELLKSMETRLLGKGVDDAERLRFRQDTQKEYAARTFTQDILLDGMNPRETSLYKSLYERYVYNLKQKVLEPFLDNENFLRAIKDYDTEGFKTYDQRIRNDVTFLIRNLCGPKYHYTEQSAKEVGGQ